MPFSETKQTFLKLLNERISLNTVPRGVQGWNIWDSDCVFTSRVNAYRRLVKVSFDAPTVCIRHAS